MALALGEIHSHIFMKRGSITNVIGKSTLQSF